jgi:hypothetical protein
MIKIPNYNKIILEFGASVNGAWCLFVIWDLLFVIYLYFGA